MDRAKLSPWLAIKRSKAAVMDRNKVKPHVTVSWIGGTTAVVVVPSCRAADGSGDQFTLHSEREAPWSVVAAPARRPLFRSRLTPSGSRASTIPGSRPGPPGYASS